MDSSRDDETSESVAAFVAHRRLGCRQDPLRRFARHCSGFVDNNAGLLLIAASQVFTSLMGVFVKKLNAVRPPVHPLELIWLRMVLTWIVCIAYMLPAQVPDPFVGPKGIRLLLVLRGFSGFVGLFGTYYALQYLSLSDTTVLSFLTPMTTAISGALLLKETFTWKQALASACSFIGVILIARPAFLFSPSADTEQGSAESSTGVTPVQRLGAVGVALLGVIGLTSAYTTIRAIGKRAHPMHNLAAFALVCIVTAPVAVLVSNTNIVILGDFDMISGILTVSLSGFAAQMTMTTGLQRETAGRGTMAIYVQVIFAMIFDRVFFDVVPPPLSLLGTTIILTSAIYVAFSKHGGERANSDKEVHSDGAELQRGLLDDEHGRNSTYELLEMEDVTVEEQG
ncbi:drug/metabolite transporter [Trametes elegans]|nr:drug/metabolite transporter [Trametes elegans]